jgi:hypothetical protein
MKAEIIDYHQNSTVGSATINIFNEFLENVMDLTVEFEFSINKYQTGDGITTPIEDWADVEITDIEYFNEDLHRFTPKKNITECIEECLINEIKDRV